MVIICKDTFSQDTVFQPYFQKFPFPLSDFQKYAIQAIVEGDHILVTAHTGSGKTLPAEFAIEYFVARGKKVIYTSPIKALSNQKFHEFTQKFPGISFGILTGDIKFNPEADVLIMTTEILRNTLLQKSINSTSKQSTTTLQFEMDFQSELAAVIFDEVHYINDHDRGKVWEETIMLLPSQIQLVMLSATIDKSEIFAKWIEDVKTSDTQQKKVYLAPTNYRVVPLKHYFYTTLPQGTLKNIKDKEFLKYINEFLHKPIIAKDENNNFHISNFEKVKKLLSYIQKNNCHIKPAFVLTEIVKYLNQNEMLPAICFVFSRKMVEQYAKTINYSLFEIDSTIPSTIQYECEQILRKLPNHKEYTQLPEFHMIIKLLEKGVAIHHSGIMPIFREMIELLFAKGYIKLLFATETFAVGINMPTKTVIFTGFEKFNGSSMRLLYPHEYTQMAGRAGRRGLDTIGHVIHLSTMFNPPTQTEYFNLLNGSPQTLQSKFHISYNLILNFLQYNDNPLEFAKKSMCNGEIIQHINGISEHIKSLEQEFNKKTTNPLYEYVINNKHEFENYIILNEEMKHAKQNTRKQIQKKIEDIKAHNKNFLTHLDQYNNIINMEQEMNNNREYIITLTNHFQNTYMKNIKFLHKFDYVNLSTEFDNIKIDTIFEIDNVNKLSISDKGRLATYVQETHCLAMVDLLIKFNYFNSLDSYEIAALLSCFSNIRVKEESKIYNTTYLTTSDNLNNVLSEMTNIYDTYSSEEINNGLENTDTLNYTFELVNPILNWCESNNDYNCKEIISSCEYKHEIFAGEFIKSILKINNMVNELKNIAEYVENIEFLHKLTQIPDLTLKFIATNQSLYI